jgi:hypothetical protein
MKTVITFLLIIGISLAGCSPSADEDATKPGGSDSGAYEDAYSAAEAAIKKAHDKGHAWTTTEALLAASRQAADNGDFDQAIELANEAKRHGQLASAQADFESEAWRERVITD